MTVQAYDQNILQLFWNCWLFKYRYTCANFFSNTYL